MVTDGITHFAHIQMTRFLSGLGTFSAICQCQQMINCSQVRHCAPHFRMWSAPLPCQPGRRHRSPPWVPVPHTCQQKVMTLQSSRRDERASETCSHDFEHMVSQPWEWKKKLHIWLLAFPSNLFYGRFHCMWCQANKCQVRQREQKQRLHGSTVLRDGRTCRCVCVWCEHSIFVYCFLKVCTHVSVYCMCVAPEYSGRWNHAPPSTGSPWLALTRIADHINATTHLSLPPTLPPFLSHFCHLQSLSLRTFCQT